MGAPFVVAVMRESVDAILTSMMLMFLFVGERTRTASAVPVPWTTGPLAWLSMVLVVPVDFDDTDMACYSMPTRAAT